MWESARSCLLDYNWAGHSPNRPQSAYPRMAGRSNRNYAAPQVNTNQDTRHHVRGDALAAAGGGWRPPRNPHRPHAGYRRPQGPRPMTATSDRQQSQGYQNAGNAPGELDQQQLEMVEAAGVDPDKYREILRRMIENGNKYARKRPQTAGYARQNYAATAPTAGNAFPHRHRPSGGRAPSGLSTPGDPWGRPATAALGGRARINTGRRDGPKEHALEPYKHAVHLAVDFAAKIDPAKREKIFREHNFEPFDRYTHEESAVLAKYLLGEKLGHGAYATVRLGWCKGNRAGKVAVKMWDSDRTEWTELRHTLLMAFSYLILEHISGGCLNEYLRKLPGHKVDEATAKKFMAQICAGVKYCHDKRIVHRDLKLENILLERGDRIKIIDFGFSTSVPEGQNVKIFCGTPSYMCPQLINGGEYNGFKADMWAIGVILYVMIFGGFPFRAHTQKELYMKIQKGRFYLPDPTSPILAPGARAILKRLLKVDADERMDANQLGADPWLEGVPKLFSETQPQQHQMSYSSTTSSSSTAPAIRDLATDSSSPDELKPETEASGDIPPSYSDPRAKRPATAAPSGSEAWQAS
ncbi:hypothetical protein FOL47_001901 [Perkinsus chesapeaki]|uniref:Protein kinase domain-containing protein n=1 Tax=Perkinsus chesapeaki TaxID=330153 RepID=A0A7J6MGA7_PERCH|nr:hypothetical protein FOL47_001901 [Perkinsus chesapeaki]